MSNTIKATKGFVNDVIKHSNHLKHLFTIQDRIGKYLEKIGYDTETGWDGLYRIHIVDGELIEKNGKEYLQVDGHPLASANNDGVYCHQVVSYCGDDYSGEFYIPVVGKQYVQVHFQM